MVGGCGGRGLGRFVTITTFLLGICIQWNPRTMDTLGVGGRVPYREVVPISEVVYIDTHTTICKYTNISMPVSHSPSQTHNIDFMLENKYNQWIFHSTMGKHLIIISKCHYILTLSYTFRDIYTVYMINFEILRSM